MKSTIETLSPTRVRLAIEVPFEELRTSFDAAYKRIGAQVRVPGFRPGKVPGRILEQRIGRPAILEEVINDAVPKAYGEAVRDNDVRVLGQPAIEVTRVDDGEAVGFTAEVDVRPEIDLEGIDSLAVTVDDLAVSPEEIDEQMAVLRERFATLIGVDRPIENGDYVSIDLAVTVDGESVEDGSATGLSYEVGSAELVDGVDEALLGVEAGTTTTFETQLPGGVEPARTADVSVTVRSVKEKELPQLDDEFAQTASEFDTIEEFRADVRTRLERLKAMQQGGQARDRLIEALLEATEVPLPESVVTAEIEWREHNINHQLEETGQSLQAYLDSEDQTEEQFRSELRTNSEKAVKGQLILDAYADQQGIGVSDDDLMQHIVLQAQRYGVPPEQFAQQVSQGGNLPSFVADVRRNKALAQLLNSTVVTDASDRPVDLAALRPQPEPAIEPAADGGAVPEDPAGVVPGDPAGVVLSDPAGDPASVVPSGSQS